MQEIRQTTCLAQGHFLASLKWLGPAILKRIPSGKLESPGLAESPALLHPSLIFANLIKMCRGLMSELSPDSMMRNPINYVLLELFVR